jgi:hypothetical protein
MLAALMAAPALAEAQRSPREQGQRSEPNSIGGARSGGGGDRRAVPRGASGGDSSGRTADSGRTRATAGSGDSGERGRSPDPGLSRPRGDRPATGEAVARHDRGRRGDRGRGRTIVVPGYPGYYDYPWSYGFGFGYLGGFYDPWWYGSGGGYPIYVSRSDDWGRLRLKVKPVEATVYVDGYYAGIVDEFDGVFQRLHLDPGPHRLEVRLDGYEPLTFEVLIQPDKTTTFTGELKEQ